MYDFTKFAQDNGIPTKTIHGMKAQQKIDFFAQYFGFTGNIPRFKKEMAKKFLVDFFKQEEKTPENFKTLFEHYVHKYLLSKESRHIDEHTIVITNLPAANFYASPEWRALRYRVLESRGNKCDACGRSPRDNVVIHVDHILPRSVFPEHALSYENMQILCEDCNLGKSNKYTTDWRTR